MLVETSCLAESRRLLERALRTRGYNPTVTERTFKVETSHGRFSLSFLPGNRRILVSHDTQVNETYRNHGIGRKWLTLKSLLAKECGCNLLMATVRNDNKPEVHLLRTSGWKRILNRKTQVSLWVKTL